MNIQDSRPPVLIVDDEPRILDALRDLLSESFEVVSSADAAAALELLEDGEFAVILADQRMPGLAGDEFLAKAKNLSDATRILVTGYADIDALIRAVNLGQIHTYVSKPWEPAQLRVTVLKGVTHCRETIQRKKAAKLLEEQQRALAASEAAFRQQTKLLQSILDSMGEGVLVTDEHGQMVLLNTAAQAMVGPEAAETPRSQWGERFGIFRPGTDAYYPPDDLPLSRAMRGETADAVELFVRNDQKPEGMFVSVNVRPLKDDDGSGRGGVAVVRDITVNKRSEDLLRRAKEEAERANRAKSDFLSRMSHELRTPLNSILGFAQVLEMGALPESEQGSVEQILKGGQHLLALINEVLDVARIESGRMALSVEPVHLTEVVKEALDMVRPLAERRGIALGGVADEFDGFVSADRQRFLQVLINLVANGVKYNVDGGRVDVSCEARTDKVRICVSDTGHGISKEDQERLFQPFERLAGESLAAEGTGLGLALSKGLVEGMQGAIGVHSAPTGGSTFWVELHSADRPADLLPDLEGIEPAEATASEAQRRTVLYIEDNRANLELMERIVGMREEIELVGAMQGGLGLELARDHHPDLILLDLHLPDMTGQEVLRELQRDPETRSIPVVVVSADATPGQMEKVLVTGAQSYMTKPLDVASMLRLLDATLEGSGTPSDRRQPNVSPC